MANDHHSQALRADTRGIAIHAAPDDVFHFVAEPQNLPLWAVGFCRSIRRGDGDDWIVSTGSGDVALRYRTNAAARTVDFHFAPAPGVEAVAYSRVLPNGAGSEYVFTQYQTAGMPDDVFERQVQALIAELDVLRGLLRARAACPT